MVSYSSGIRVSRSGQHPPHVRHCDPDRPPSHSPVRAPTPSKVVIKTGLAMDDASAQSCEARSRNRDEKGERIYASGYSAWSGPETQ